jgi:Arc/MetJ family transcription regulator
MRNLMHMRTTLILDDELIEKAKALTGLTEKTAVVHAGLRALIVQHSARKLAALGGTDRAARAPSRRRPSRAKT